MQCLGRGLRDTSHTMAYKIKEMPNLVSWIRDSRLAQGSGQEAFALLPITASLAHDETAAAEVHGRGPVFETLTGSIALCARSASVPRATDGRKSERGYSIVCSC
jgi:hypothetical protein